MTRIEEIDAPNGYMCRLDDVENYGAFLLRKAKTQKEREAIHHWLSNARGKIDGVCPQSVTTKKQIDPLNNALSPGLAKFARTIAIKRKGAA